MKIEKIIRVSAEDWSKYSEDAHRAVFGTIKPAYFDRISYALLAISDTDEPVSYITVREHDHETVYYQFSGVFPKFRKTLTPVKAYTAFLEYQKCHSKRVTTYIENTNFAMLKMALFLKFVVIGTRTFGGSIFLDLVKELK